MYSLDLETWGMEGSVLEEDDEGRDQRAAVQERAEAIFKEVRKMVEGFHTTFLFLFALCPSTILKISSTHPLSSAVHVSLV